MAVTNYHQSWLSGRSISVNKVEPFYWCLVPPKTAWSAGNMSIGFLSEETSMDKAGLVEMAGYFIPNAFDFTERIDKTPLQLRDKYLPMIDAQNFDIGNSTTDDDRIATPGETLFNDQVDQLPGDDIEGRDADSGPQENSLLSHKAVWDMVNWWDLGPRRIFHKMQGVGVPYGMYQPIDANTVRYQADFSHNAKMIGSNGVGVVLYVASLQELGADEAGSSDEKDERISQWTNIPSMIQAMLDAKDWITDILTSGDPDDWPDGLKKLAQWKRVYSVGDDTWHNENGKLYVNASTTLTSFWDEDRLHV